MCKKDFTYLKTQMILKKGEWDPPNAKTKGRTSGCQQELWLPVDLKKLQVKTSITSTFFCHRNFLCYKNLNRKQWKIQKKIEKSVKTFLSEFHIWCIICYILSFKIWDVEDKNKTWAVLLIITAQLPVLPDSVV